AGQAPGPRPESDGRQGEPTLARRPGGHAPGPAAGPGGGHRGRPRGRLLRPVPGAAGPAPAPAHPGPAAPPGREQRPPPRARPRGRGGAQSTARGQITVAVSREPGRPARQAALTVRFLGVVLEPPANHPRRRHLRPLPLTAVLAVEEDPPPGQPPLRWLLLT